MGKRLIVALALMVLACTECRAETPCRAPARPELPPSNADSNELEKAGKEINAYIKAMKEYRECLLKIVNDADNELATVVEGWNYAVERFRDGRGRGEDSGK